LYRRKKSEGFNDCGSVLLFAAALLVADLAMKFVKCGAMRSLFSVTHLGLLDPDDRSTMLLRNVGKVTSLYDVTSRNTRIFSNTAVSIAEAYTAIYYLKYVNGRRTGLVTFCVETAFYNGLLKERYKGGIGVTGRQGRRRRKLLEDIKERGGYSHLNRELWIALCGELALEEALDLSEDRLLNE
jgi:hypothetical protein